MSILFSKCSTQYAYLKRELQCSLVPPTNVLTRLRILIDCIASSDRELYLDRLSDEDLDFDKLIVIVPFEFQDHDNSLFWDSYLQVPHTFDVTVVRIPFICSQTNVACNDALPLFRQLLDDTRIELYGNHRWECIVFGDISDVTKVIQTIINLSLQGVFQIRSKSIGSMSDIVCKAMSLKYDNVRHVDWVRYKTANTSQQLLTNNAKFLNIQLDYQIDECLLMLFSHLMCT